MYENSEIEDSVKEFLTYHHCRTANFYLLPKIYKGILPPPGRPILCANGSPTEKISWFTDYFLTHLCPKVKSYVKDSTHFLQILELRDIPSNCHLVSLDVSNLYINIPVLQSKAAIKASLESNRPQIGVKLSNKALA